MTNLFKKLLGRPNDSAAEDKAKEQEQRLRDLQRQARMLGVELDAYRRDTTT